MRANAKIGVMAVGSILLINISLLPADADDAEIIEVCTSTHPRPVLDYLDRKNCIQTQTLKKRDEEERRKKEQRVRPLRR